MIGLLVLGVGIAHADSSVTVTLNAQGEQLASDLGLSVPDLIDHAKSQIDELYRVSRIDQLLRAVADTAAFAQRGLGVDYDVDDGDVIIGGAEAGVHGDVAIGTTNTLLGGSIVNFAAMTGVNLARWQHPRWTVFASGFYETATIHGLDGHLGTLGAHVQYRVLPPARPARVRWTGLAATTGLEYARWTLGTSSAIESHFTAQGPTQHATIHMSSTGTLDVLTSTFAVPVEVTTGVRLYNTLTLYGGGGLDLTAGTSSIVAQLDSVLSINADHLPVGNAVITGTGENTPSPVAVHALFGTEIHTRHVRVVLQGAFAPAETNVSLALRIVP